MSALREGSGWETYLEFDFRTVARINKILVGRPTSIGSVPVRPASRVSVMYSHVPGLVTSVFASLVDVREDGEIEVEQALEARVVRLVVESAAAGAVDEAPIGVNK